MKSERIELRVTPEMREAIDVARGDVPLNRWAERAFEKALSGSPQGATPPSEKGSRTPAASASPAAPSRASARRGTTLAETWAR